MKKLVLILLVSFTLVNPQKAYSLDPKTKAFLVVTAYGTVGGALLGFASMAFGSDSRAIAQGASLGLYAGILFGAYILATYDSSEEADPYTPPPGYEPYPGDPYSAPAPDAGGSYGPPTQYTDDPSFTQRIRVDEINDNYRLNFRSKRDFSVPVYMNLYQASF